MTDIEQRLRELAQPISLLIAMSAGETIIEAADTIHSLTEERDRHDEIVQKRWEEALLMRTNERDAYAAGAVFQMQRAEKAESALAAPDSPEVAP